MTLIYDHDRFIMLKKKEEGENREDVHLLKSAIISDFRERLRP